MARAFSSFSEPVPEIQIVSDGKYQYDEYPQTYTAWYMLPIKLGSIKRVTRLNWEHDSGIRTRTMTDMQSILLSKVSSGELAQYMPAATRRSDPTAPGPTKYKFTAAQLINKGVWAGLMAIRPKVAAEIKSTGDVIELTKPEMEALKLEIPGEKDNDKTDSGVQAG